VKELEEFERQLSDRNEPNCWNLVEDCVSKFTNSSFVNYKHLVITIVCGCFCLKEFEEISLNYIFLLTGKYKTEIHRIFSNFSLTTITDMFLSLYQSELHNYSNEELFEKFKLYVIKCVMLGTSLAADASKTFEVILEAYNSVHLWSRNHDRRSLLRNRFLIYVALLIFRNGYNPHDDFDSLDTTPEEYRCYKIASSNGEFDCTLGSCRCRFVKLIFICYDSFIKDSTLFDLLSARLGMPNLIVETVALKDEKL